MYQACGLENTNSRLYLLESDWDTAAGHATNAHPLRMLSRRTAQREVAFDTNVQLRVQTAVKTDDEGVEYTSPWSGVTLTLDPYTVSACVL